MLEKTKASLQLLSQSALLILRTILGYGFFACLLNITLIAFLRPELSLFWRGKTFVTGKLLFILSTLMFSFVFPFLFVLLGKKQGILKALNYIFTSQKTLLIEYVLEKFIEYSKTEKGEKKVTSTGDIIGSLQLYLKSMENLPLVLRWICGFFTQKVDFVGITTQLIEAEQINSETLASENFISSVSIELSNRLSTGMWKTNYFYFFLLASINTALFAVIKFSY
ncbi:MAG: hypothetical protein ACI86H_000047 [bacterium]|jgi:hypothetical protein